MINLHLYMKKTIQYLYSRKENKMPKSKIIKDVAIIIDMMKEY